MLSEGWRKIEPFRQSCRMAGHIEEDRLNTGTLNAKESGKRAFLK